jgi:hypothetical protein
MGNGSSAGPPCRGNAPGEIREFKDDIGNRSNWIIKEATRINGKIDEYHKTRDGLNVFVGNIKNWYYNNIPDRIKSNKWYVADQTYKKNVELQDSIFAKDESLATLNANLAILDDTRKSHSMIEDTTLKAKAYLNTTFGGAINAVHESEIINLNTYNTIQIENDAILNSTNNNIEKNSASGSKNTNISTNLDNLMAVRFFLYLIYYILIIAILYIYIYKQMNIYIKIALISILLLYPLYIYNIQYYIIYLWNVIYAYTRISVPENP